jgi:hypothetical protein
MMSIRSLLMVSEEAQQVLAQLECTCIKYADALLLLNGRSVPVRGLLSILNRSEEFIAVPVHKEHLPKELYADVVYLRCFADVAERIRAPFGADTVYQVKPRKARGRTGAYKLPAPAPSL